MGGRDALWCRWAARLLTLALIPAATSACGDTGSSGVSDPAPATLEAPTPADGEYEYGRFRFGRAYSGGSGDAALASYSWDIVYYLDSGDVGSWSAGYDVFEASTAAEEEARRVARRWPCADDPKPLEDIDSHAYDFLDGSYCRALSGKSYIAQLSAARGHVTANLVVSGPTDHSAAAAAVAVWHSLSEAVQSALTAAPSPSS